MRHYIDMLALAVIALCPLLTLATIAYDGRPKSRYRKARYWNFYE